MRFAVAFIATVFVSTPIISSPTTVLNCDLGSYKGQTGLTAAVADGLLVVTWKGERDAELRARYGIDNGQPLVRDVSVRKGGEAWATLGKNLKPEYRVVTGVRRMSTQQADPLRQAGVELTPEV